MNRPSRFRGCIAVGELIATQNVLVGEPVDDAAEFFEKADAAMIWLTPKANDNWVVWTGSRSATILCDVPLTTGSTVSTRALNPLTACVASENFPGGAQGYAKFKELTQQAFRVHSTGPLAASVQQKLDNTLAFLDGCEVQLNFLAEQEMEMIRVAMEGLEIDAHDGDVDQKP